MTTKDRIIDFIKRELVKDDSIKEIGECDPLISTGIIDSLGIVSLVSFIDQELEVNVLDEDIVVENFQDVKSIVTFIEAK